MLRDFGDGEAMLKRSTIAGMIRTAIVLASVLATCTPSPGRGVEELRFRVPFPGLRAAAPSASEPAPPTPPEAPPSSTWTVQWGGANFDAVLAIAVSGRGETFAVGEGSGAMRFTTTGGGAAISVTAPAIEMSRSGLFAQYSSGGELRHAVPFEAIYNALGVAATPDGGAMVVGTANTPIVAGADGIPVRKEPDGFIARFDPYGRRLWLHRIIGDARVETRHIAAHPRGGYIIAGIHGGVARFESDRDAPPFGTPATFAGFWDVFLARIDDDAQVQWLAELGGPNQESVVDLEVGRDGTAVLVGECRDDTMVRGGAKVVKIKCDALSIATFLATWTATGELVWAARVPGPAKDTQTPEGVAITEDGEYVAVGMFSKGIGGGPLPRLRNTQPTFVDGFAVRYTAAGQPRWIRHFRGSGTERVWAVAPAGTGTWVLAEPGVDLEIGDGKTYKSQTAAIGGNPLLLRLDADGRIAWAESLAGRGDLRATRLLTPGGDLLIAGSFGGELQNGNATISAVGHLDGFILARPPPDAPAEP